MNTGVKRDLLSGHGLLKKGEMVVYEGEKAEVIGVNPLLIIKLENRVLCGALHNHIEYEREVNTLTQ